MHRAGWFTRFASRAAHYSGHPATFLAACTIVIVWALSGPMMGFSEVWQLTINTGTTIITFLMVFIIQNTQNRDSVAVQVKLDELIRATRGARNSLLDLEELSEDQLEEMRKQFETLASRSRSRKRTD